MKKIFSLALASVFVVGTLSACTPAPTQPEVTPPPAATQGAGTTPTPTPPTPEPPAPEAAFGRGITVATQNEAPSIAPARHNAMAGGYKNLLTHNGLFRACYSNLAQVPDLVASWEAISDTVFEFTIYEGIRFHNGDIMTAHDVAASLEYVRTTPDARSAHLSMDSWEVVDEHTIRIDTGEPNAMLLADLAHSGNFIMPMSLIEAGHDFNAQPIGSGPFVFEEWRFGDSLTFTAFEDYFDTARSSHIEYITWRIIPEGSSRTIALETGEADFVVEVAFSDVPRLESDPNITVFTRPGTGHNQLLLNTSLPIFENIHVRHAIDMAIDREAIVIAGFNGLAFPTSNQVPNVFDGVSNDNLRDFDPEGARALLAEHGINPAEITFDIIADNEDRRRMGEVVQANLAEIGIEVTLTMNDLATSLQRMTDGDFEAAFAGFTSASLLGFMRAVLTTEPARENRSRIDVPEINELVLAAVGIIDTDERNALLYQASAIANEHTGLIPTHQVMIIRAFNANLIAPEINAVGNMNFNTVFWAE